MLPHHQCGDAIDLPDFDSERVAVKPLDGSQSGYPGNGFSVFDPDCQFAGHDRELHEVRLSVRLCRERGPEEGAWGFLQSAEQRP